MIYANRVHDFVFSTLRHGLALNSDVTTLMLLWGMWPAAMALEYWRASHALTPLKLQEENRAFQGTGGISANNRNAGFRPAFRDNSTGHVYLSRCADGRPAPVHVLDGLPKKLVLQRNAEGRPIAVEPSVVAGFLREEKFFTREQAARLVAKQAEN